MKIELIKLRFNQTFSYKYKSFTYCCNALKNNPCILFTDEDVMSDPSYSISDQDNSLPRFCMTRTLSFRDWEDEWKETENIPIRFCPHCGEEIQIHVSEEQDLSRKYQELSKERAKLWKQCQKTDSKKKEAQLQDQVHELDRKINQYLELSNIEDLSYAN